MDHSDNYKDKPLLYCNFMDYAFQLEARDLLYASLEQVLTRSSFKKEKKRKKEKERRIRNKKRE